MTAARRDGPKARDELVQFFRPSIANVARAYRRSTSVEWNELMQEGVVGLLRALERYDAELGVPFWSYARWWVRQAIQQLVSELSGPVVLSDRALRQLARIKSAQREYEQREGHEPRANDLAVACRMPPRQVECLMAADRSARALEEPSAGEERTGATLGDLLADPRAEDAYESATWRLAATQLPQMLSGLSRRERQVIRGRFGLHCREQTLGELAGDLGVSAERIRQIEQASLDKIRMAGEHTPSPAPCG